MITDFFLAYAAAHNVRIAIKTIRSLSGMPPCISELFIDGMFIYYIAYLLIVK